MKSVRVIGRSGADTSLVTATADDVLEGKVIVDRYGEELVGTIPVYTADGDTELIKLEVGDTYQLPKGYYDEGAVTIINDRATYVNGSATRHEVLEGYTIPIDGIPVEGAIHINRIPEHNELGLYAGESINIELGYYPDSFVVGARDLESQTPGTADDVDILEGQTAWVNGVELVGTIPIKVASSCTLEGGQQVVFEPGYYGKHFDVSALSLDSQTPATATSESILEGETAWVYGEEITGTIPIIQDITDITLDPGDNTTLASGYYPDSITITAAEAPTVDLSSQTVGTATAADIVKGKTAWVNGEEVTGTLDSSFKLYGPNEGIIINELPLTYFNTSEEGRAIYTNKDAINTHTKFGEAIKNKKGLMLEFTVSTLRVDTIDTFKFFVNLPNSQDTGTIDISEHVCGFWTECEFELYVLENEDGTLDWTADITAKSLNSTDVEKENYTIDVTSKIFGEYL